MIDTRVKICGVEFKNPVITASGTFNFGEEYNEYFDVGKLGGICVKGLTPMPREGNPPPRILEVPGGILNSVGLQNPGVSTFVDEVLPRILKFNTNIIANISGNTVEEYCEMAEKLSDTEVSMLEMNISCPNVRQGGAAFGTDAKMVEHITKEVKKYSRQPLIVKLSPNVTSVAEIAQAAECGGADAISLINTLLGMKIDIKTKRPLLKNNVGGLSGPAVRPIAVRMVWQVKNAVSLPVIGMGGIMTAEDAIEFMLAGASLVAVGTASLINPCAATEIAEGIEKYMLENNILNVDELIGGVLPY